MLSLVACLAMLTPYNGYIANKMPGNASEFRFIDCVVKDVPQGREVKLYAWARARQTTCTWGRCITLWSYTSNIYGYGLLDQNCDLKVVNIEMSPRNPVLEKFVPELKEGAFRKWPDVRGDYLEFCP